MNGTGPERPGVREAFYVVLASFTLYLAALLILKGNDPVSLFFTELSIVLPAVIWVRMQKYSFRTVFGFRRFNLFHAVPAVILGFGFNVLTAELNILIQNVVPMDKDVLRGLTEILMYESPFEMVVLILTLVVAAGIGEEMLFRGLLMGALGKSVSITRAVIYSALVFTFLHFNPWWTIEIFLLGVFTGVLAWRAGSLVPAVAMHATVNLVSLLLINHELSFLDLYLKSGHIRSEWLWVSGGCVIAGMVLFVLCTRNAGGKSPAGLPA